MADVTISKGTINRLVKKLDVLSNPTREKDARSLGALVVREMKRDIGRLNSPIRGRGKFPALKEPYKSRKQRQVGSDKPDLKLSGDFLKSLGSDTEPRRDGFATVIGFDDALSNDKEAGHRKGTNRQRKRPIIPNEREGFNRRISALIENFFLKRVRDIIRT